MITIIATRGDKELLRGVSPEALGPLLDDPQVRVWIDIAGAMDDAALRLVRDRFHFHPLSIADCFETRMHPKVEEFESYVYVIAHGMTAGSTPEETDTVELDAFVGARYLVTYHSSPSRSIEAVKGLVERGGGGPLRRGSASLLSAILDKQVDGIEPVLEQLEARIEDLEEQVLARPRNEDLAALFALKRTTLQLRRWISKQREVVLRLARGEFPLIERSEAILFRDIYDHLARFTDLLDNFREMLGSLQDMYLNVTNLRLSEIMKFLTIFTTLLMPLTVISGIYGMNFAHMPGLEARHGFSTVLGLMAATSLSILWLFKKRGWLDRDRPRPVPPPPPPVEVSSGGESS